MSSLTRPVIAVFSLLVGCSSSVDGFGLIHHSSFGRGAPLASSSSSSSYLDSLVQQSGGVATTTTSTNVPTVATTTPTTTTTSPSSSSSFAHAPLEYFGLDKLTSKGPRETADWGQPQDATRLLAKDKDTYGTLSAGSWFCSTGGWPSPNPKAHTEIFVVLTGHGCLSDGADGITKHYFGPGDTVIIPKGHTGRWDVLTDMHKVWAVNAHERIEETTTPIRVQVDHYHNLFAPQNLLLTSEGGGSDPLYGSSSSDVATIITSQTFYDVGPTKVGVWTCGSPASIRVSELGGANNKSIFFHLLEGVVFVTTTSTGDCRRCVAGDTVMFPQGWKGHIDVIEAAKKLWVTAEG